MKGTLIGGVIFVIMAGWTLFSDIFEYFTHLPVILPTYWLTQNPQYAYYAIIWSDYLMITSLGLFFELVIAVMLFYESRKQDGPYGYDPTLGNRKNG